MRIKFPSRGLLKLILVISLFLADRALIAQEGCLPHVAWKRADWPHYVPEGPVLAPVPGSAVTPGSYQHRDQSGEDWWYDLTTIFENGIHTGYMVAGYATWVDLTIDESTAGGCCIHEGTNIPNCNRPILAGETLGPKLITVARYDLDGHMQWCRSYAYATEGAIAITATSDGHFAFTGWGKLTRTINGDPVCYNPVSPPFHDIPGISPVYCDTLSEKMLVGKIDAQGNLLWLYQYGYYDLDNGPYSNEAVLAARVIGTDLVETTGGQLVIAGRSQDLNNTGTDEAGNTVAFSKIFLLELNSDGMIVRRKLAGETNHHSEATAIEQSGGNFMVTGFQKRNGLNAFDGEPAEALLFCLDSDLNIIPFGNTPWLEGSTTIEKRTPINGKNSIGWDVRVLQNGTIAWAFFEDCAGCIGGSYNPENNMPDARIFLYRQGEELPFKELDLGTINTYGFSKCEAFDIKIGITTTQDSGFACVTTFQVDEPAGSQVPYGGILAELGTKVNDPNDPDCSKADLSRANTDAWIGRFDAEGNLLWDISLDADDAPVRPYPGDWKEQECVFRITEAADGSLVFVGNTSHNKDDYYIASVTDRCDAASFELEVYPVPTNGPLVVVCSDDHPGEKTIRITDLAGKEILRVPVSGYSSGIQLDLASFAAGVYLLSLCEADRVIASRKLVLIDPIP